MAEPDATFGQGGRVRLGANWNFYLRAVHMQPDGRIILMGQAGTGVNGLYPLIAPAQVGLIRLLADGSLDRSFGQDGVVIWSPPRRPDTRIMEARVGVLQRQPDGRLLISMYLSEHRFSVPLGGLAEVGRAAFVRFNRNGSVDESFGRAGLVERPKAPESVALWAALPGGKFVALTSNGLLRRFTADGAIDRGFGRHGSGWLWEEPAGLAAARDGSLIAIANDDSNVGSPLRRILPGGGSMPHSAPPALVRRCRSPWQARPATSDGVLATASTLPTAFIPLNRGSPPDTTLFASATAREDASPSGRFT